MKNRIGALGIIPIMLVSLSLSPSPVQASSAQGWTHFTASAGVAVESGEPDVITPQPPRVHVHTVGERVVATIIASSGWPEIDGASIEMLHNADLTLNFAALSLSGKASGTIQLTTLKSGVMAGTYEANIRGKFSVLPDGNIVYERVFDVVKWRLDGVSGDLANVDAQGEAFVALDDTLTGTMDLSGTFR